MDNNISSTRQASDALYQDLKNSGYEGLPSQDSFYNTIQDSTQAAALYQDLKDSGYEGLPERESFYKTLIEGYGSKTGGGTAGDGGKADADLAGLVDYNTQYDPEVIRRYNDPGNTAGNFKDLAQIAKEYAEEQGAVNGGAQPTWSQERITDDVDPKNPYVGMTRQEAVNEVGRKFFDDWYGGKDDAYQKVMTELAAYNIASPEEIGHVTAAIRGSYVDPVARRRVEQLLGKFDKADWSNIEDIRAVMDSRETQKAIEDDLNRLGFGPTENAYDKDDEAAREKARKDYQENKDAYYQVLAKQLQNVLADKYGYAPAAEDARSDVRRIGNALISGGSEAHDDRIEAREMSGLLEQHFQPAIDAAFAAGDERAEAVRGQYGDALRYTPAEGQFAVNTKITKAANEQRDPEEMLKTLTKEVDSSLLGMLSDERMKGEIAKRAAAKGMSEVDYFDKYVSPQVVQVVADKFQKDAVAREMPKSTIEYVLRKMEDSLAGTLLGRTVMTKGQQQNRRMGMAAAEAGQGDYTPGLGARIAGGVAGIAPDLPLFALPGGVAAGAGRGAAEVAYTLGARPLIQRIAASSLSGAVSMGTVEGLKGGVEGALFGDDDRGVPEYLRDIIGGAVERGSQSFISGLGMIGGPIGQKIANGRGVIGQLLGWGAQAGVDAAGATGISVVSGDVQTEDVPEHFAENFGTFLGLGWKHKMKDITATARGGRQWNGVHFTKEEVERMEQLDDMSTLREILGDVEKVKDLQERAERAGEGGLLSSMMGIDRVRKAELERQKKLNEKAANDYGTAMYNDVMRSYMIPGELKVKVSQATGMPLPDYALKPEVTSVEQEVARKSVVNNLEQLLDNEYYLAGGVRDKVLAGEGLTDHELAVKLLYQDYERYAQLAAAEEGGERLTREDAEFMYAYEQRIAGVCTDLVDTQREGQQRDFEVAKGLEEGTVERILKDVHDGKALNKKDDEIARAYQQEMEAQRDIIAEAEEQRKQQEEERSLEEEQQGDGEDGNDGNDGENGDSGITGKPGIDGGEQEPQQEAGEEQETQQETQQEMNTEASGETAGNGGIDRETRQEEGSRIPVDEKGKKLWEKARPEDVMPELTALYGGEKAAAMATRMAEKTRADFEDLNKTDSATMDDIDEMTAHEDQLIEAKKRMEFWENVVKNAGDAEGNGGEDGKPGITGKTGIDGEGKQNQQEQGQQEQNSEAGGGTAGDGEAETGRKETPKGEGRQAEQGQQNQQGQLPKQEQQKRSAEEEVAIGNVKSNLGRSFEYVYDDGARTEISINKVNADGTVEVTRRDYYPDGKEKGESASAVLNAIDLGHSIVNGVMKRVQTTEEKLRDRFKGKGMQNLIDVLDENEMKELLKTSESGDDEAVTALNRELLEKHHEDIILAGRRDRNENVNRILDGTGNAQDKLRKVRKEYQGYGVDEYLTDYEMEPRTLEEAVADLLGGVPKPGAGTLAYYSYGDGGNKVVGIQDETGFGKRGFGGDTKGFDRWLAPKGKGVSLSSYAESMHGYLPEGMKEQYTDVDVKNALIEVLTSAERPSDIPSMILRDRVKAAEDMVRGLEDGWISEGVNFHKVGHDFATRLKEGIEQTAKEPTEAQKAAGNYKKGHVSFGGYDFSIENPAGSMRRGKDADGKEWEQKMNNTYGYILGKYGKDGDHLDMFINDKADLDNWDGKVYVVDQVNKDGSFDEHKVMYGFDSEAEAREAYLSNYEDGWQGLGKITGVSKETFDKWLDSSGRKMKEFADHSIVKDALERGEGGEKAELPEGFDTALRDKLVEGLRESGVPVSTDWKESQRLVDEYNGKNVRFNMGDGSETFTERQRQAVENKGTVMPGLNDAQVKVVDVPRHPFTGTGRQAIKKARIWANNNLVGTHTAHQVGNEFDYSIDEDAVKKFLSSSSTLNSDNLGVHLAVLTRLPEVISESIEVEEHPDYKKLNRERRVENGIDDPNLLVHRMYGAVDIDGMIYRVKTTMHEHYGKGNAPHDYRVTKVELLISGSPTSNALSNSTGSNSTGEELKRDANGLIPFAKIIKKLKKSYDSGKKILFESEKADKKLLKQGESEENFSFHKVEDAKTLNELEKGPTVKRLRAMQMVDGKLYPPMSGNVDGKWRKPTEIGVWEQSEERPDLLNKDGKFVLKKGLKGEGRGDTPAAYNPYFHTSTSGLNDQFTAAYKRPELVVVEVEIPESELTSGYQAKGAKDHVGDIPWHSGVVNGALPKDRQRTVTLSRWSKVVRVVPDSEVAEMVAKQLEGTGVEVPYNVVTPSLRKELEARGVKISATPAGTVTEDINGNPIQKNGKIRMQKVSPVFYSNAERAVEGVKQGKASGEQWLAMIQKNGGLKAGEDKWLGLSDWLNERKGKSVTKEEVLDFIRKNQIQVEEVNYSEYFDFDDHPQMQKFQREFDEIVNRLRNEKEQNQKEIDAFDDEMYEKYGEGWANKLNEEDKNRYEALSGRHEELEDEHDLAFSEMADNYGDDFTMAFEYNPMSDKLEPQEDMYGDGISDAAAYFLHLENDEKPINGTRLQYTTNGLENKKEIALTVPTIEPWNEGDEIHFGDAGNGRAVAWVRFGETTIDAPATDLDKSLYTAKRSKNGGFDIFRPNGSEWGRIGTESAKQAIEEAYNDDMLRNTTAQRVLVIDEIQSKRHQEGREKGYGNKDKIRQLESQLEELRKGRDEFVRQLIEKYGSVADADLTDKSNLYKQYDFPISEINNQINDAIVGEIPDAPFDKNWHELAMKRMLRYAAENGFDKVAWTKGEQQAERYSLSSVVNNISYVELPNGEIDARAYFNDGSYEPLGRTWEDVEKNVGKDMVKRMQQGDSNRTASIEWGKDKDNKAIFYDYKVIDGEGLRIGGEGMKGFYDQMLPRFMDKYGKKWGVKTGEVELPELSGETAGDGGMKMWAVDVTPEMKKSVMEGQPMFFKTSDGEAYGFTLNGKIHIDPRIATSETPIHEYSHLWAEMKRKSAPEEWKQIKDALMGDKVILPFVEKVRKDYPELSGDDFVEEVLTQYSGRHGAEKLRQAAEEIAKENGGDMTAKVLAEAAIRKVKGVLDKFWRGVASMMGWKYTSAEDVADRILKDMLEGVNPRDERAAKPQGTVADEAKTLMGVHNISEEKLAKAIKTGGLANPGLAVIDTKHGMHTDFGDISLIPRSSLIDSKQGNNAGTYTGDAWTPTYPQVVRELSKKGEKSIGRIAKDAAGGNDELERHLLGNLRTFADGNDSRLHLLYLLQKGKNPEILNKKTRHTHEEYEELMKLFPTGDYSTDGLTKEQNDGLLKLMLKEYEADVDRRVADIKDEAERAKVKDMLMKNKRESIADADGKLYFSKWNNYFYAVKKDENTRKNPQVDWYGTDLAADYRIAQEGMSEDYAKWKEGLLGDEDMVEKLFAGFDRDGNRKYLPNTVENASRLMNRNGDTNAYGNGGLNATRASLLKKLGSLSEIRKHRELLQGKDAYDEKQKEMSDELFDIISQISDMQQISDNRFENTDYAEARLQEAITKRNPLGYLKKEYGYDISKDSELGRQIMNFIEEAGNLPVKYFETKFKRPVGLNEFAVAVVPEGTAAEVTDALKKAGLDVRTYDNSGTEEQKNENRRRATMDAVIDREDILFQKKVEEDGNSGNYGDSGSAGDTGLTGNTGGQKEGDAVDRLLAEVERRRNLGNTGDGEDGLLREGHRRSAEVDANITAWYEKNYTPKELRERKAYAERQWRRAHEWANDAVKKLKLNDTVQVVDSIDELEGHEKFTERKKNAKGWFDPETGKIVVVMGNHTSPSDVVKTILHEGVAHYGLRKLFGENFDAFIDNVYDNAVPDVADEIDRMAEEYNGDTRRATEEYLAKLAEDTDFERAEKSGWWQKIKSAFLKMFKKMGIDYLYSDLSDNELRYILWRSYENLAEPGRYKVPERKVQERLGLTTEEPSAEPMGTVVKTLENAENDGMLEKASEFYRDGEPESELTPEERQYWSDYEKDLRKWKSQNGLAEDAEAPKEKPTKEDGEDMMDYVMRLTQHARNKALWETAPKLEDYRRKRGDKDTLEVAREHAEKYPESQSAKMRLAAAEFAQIRTAMTQQKAYDKSTVKAVTDFATKFMQMGFGDSLSRGEMARILSSVKNATGAKDVRKYVDNVMNLLTDNMLRNLDQTVQKLSSVKELRQTAQGVERQGKLELKGQRMIQAFREAREYRMDADKIRERMAEVAEHMTAGSEEAPMWEQEYEGLSIALQYQENIEDSRNEWADLDREYKDAVKTYKESGRTYEEQQQLLESIDQAMMQNKIDRIGRFGELIGRLEGNIQESVQGAHEFINKEKERVKKIQEMVNADFSGKETGAMRVKSAGKPANFFLQPLGTFEQMLRQFGGKNASGEGYLYDHFMRSWVDSQEASFKNEQKAKETLDEKAREVFGGKVKRWSDLYSLERSLPTMDVEVIDGMERKTFTLTQGNLLYIYMADKMADGRMKLRKMGIDEATVEQIKEFLDDRLVTLADWLQDEYLVDRRVEYNKVHERMFGAPMAAIDNYFPIRVLGDARMQEQDVNDSTDTSLPSTITGNIIKRRRNSLPLDILHTDALSVAVEHVEDMERWAATAEWNREINTLLSNTTFRNGVKNMKTIYGSGDALWRSFVDTAAMAAGAYKPKAKPGSVDKAISNIAKGVTAAKINFRLYTAFKQILSAPAFLHDVNLTDFAKYSVDPYGSWKWAMENMPLFEKRWKSRQVGDTRLMDDPTDWKLWKNDIVKLATRLGMSANALVDGVTCAVGARAIYDSRYRAYKKQGADEEKARRRAMQDATIGYNLTQQSSEGAFVSAIQMDRTVAANMLSVFRNSSMAYTRQWVDASRNLKHRMQKGYKDEAVRFMAGQLEKRFGLDEAEAKAAAEADYNRQGRRDVARLLNMMFGVTIAWNLGASLPYLLIGDDNKEKEEMLKDAMMKGLIAGPTEGLAGGNIFSDLIDRTIANEETRKAFANGGVGEAFDTAVKQGGDYEINPLPLMADLQGMIGKLGYDRFAAAQDIFNICMQSAVGVNPQTATDMWMAVMDYAAPAWDGTNRSLDGENMLKAKELALFLLRMANAPTSSWRGKYIDELGLDSEDAEGMDYDEMAKRYANYKQWKDTPVLGWLRGKEGREEKMAKIRKQFDNAVAERMGRLTDEELAATYGDSRSDQKRSMAAKEAARREDAKDSQRNKNYVRERTFEDLNEDLKITKILRSDDTPEETKKIIKGYNSKMGQLKGKLGQGSDEDVMKGIREIRKSLIERLENGDLKQ